ncbi:hypothetical protein ACIBKY_32995 [Nonomuraea sp. NPDC050394]|uniref:hypothetical protein n=1 Tax=Nonomuraea sp. NPDC050394 TaxID=3364363 RepID=UPI0037980794
MTADDHAGCTDQDSELTPSRGLSRERKEAPIMGPNDVELTQVYTREPNKTIADVTFASTNDFQVVVEAEAGNAIFSGGGQFTTSIVVRDLTANDDIPFAPGSVSGQFGQQEWSREDNSFVYAVKANDLTNRKGHLCEVYAYLLAGIRNHDASLAKSRMFLIQP